MRILSLSLIAVGVAVVLGVVVLYHCLQNLDGTFAAIDLNSLAQGKVHELLAVPEVWRSGLATWPHPGSFVNAAAVFSTSCLVVICAVALQRFDLWSSAGFGLSLLCAELLAYAIGFCWLAAGNVPVEVCGPWLAWMLSSMLYGAVIAISAGAVELRRRSRSPRANLLPQSA